MIIYNLIHVYKSTDCYHDIKNLGYYSSYENAYEAIEYYKETQGFCDNKNGFAIVPYNVDSDLLNLQVVYDVYVYIDRFSVIQMFNKFIYKRRFAIYKMRPALLLKDFYFHLI